MNIKNKLTKTSEHIRRHYKDELVITAFRDEILSSMPNVPREFIVVCIGTDRSTGDALGPLTGTFLTEQKPDNLSVYGTVHEPVHATNLQDYLDYIYGKYKEPFIIAIDACLGKISSVGQLTFHRGPVRPGAALHKELPTVGDIHLTGIVNISGFMEYTVLQNTRLSVVIDMARKLAHILQEVDHCLARHQPVASIVLAQNEQKNTSSIYN